MDDLAVVNIFFSKHSLPGNYAGGMEGLVVVNIFFSKHSLPGN